MAKVLKNLLTDYGYNLVALPKSDIVPMQLLYRNANSLGAVNSLVTKLFEADLVMPPKLMPDTPVVDMTGTAAITYDVQAGVNVLESLLQKLNLGKASVKANIDGNHTITISYHNIVESKVDLLDLDRFITGAIPDTEQFGTFREKLENSDLYVINSVLKSGSFTVTVTDKDGQKVDANTSIKGIVELNADASRSKDGSITFSNPENVVVVFGFKAQRILYDSKKWWQFLKPDGIRFRIIDQQGEILRGPHDDLFGDNNQNDTYPFVVLDGWIDI